MPKAAPCLIIIKRLQIAHLHRSGNYQNAQNVSKIMDHNLKRTYHSNAILIRNLPPGCSIMRALQNWPSDGTTTIPSWFCNLHRIFSLSVWQHKISYHLESKGFNTAYHRNGFSTLVTVFHDNEIFICGASWQNPNLVHKWPFHRHNYKLFKFNNQFKINVMISSKIKNQKHMKFHEKYVRVWGV